MSSDALLVECSTTGAGLAALIALRLTALPGFFAGTLPFGAAFFLAAALGADFFLAGWRLALADPFFFFLVAIVRAYYLCPAGFAYEDVRRVARDPGRSCSHTPAWRPWPHSRPAKARSGG
jgi:hypothetical protein